MKKKYKLDKDKSLDIYRLHKIPALCRLYEEQDLDEQTVRKWIKSGKLKALLYQGEWYIYGAVWKQFLLTRIQESKRTLEFYQFKCSKTCKKIDSPLDNIVTKLITGRGGCLLAFGICKHCGHEIQRPYKKSERSKIYETFTINLEQPTTLYNSPSPTTTTHIEIVSKMVVSESLKNDTTQVDQNDISCSVACKETQIVLDSKHIITDSLSKNNTSSSVATNKTSIQKQLSLFDDI